MTFASLAAGAVVTSILALPVYAAPEVRQGPAPAPSCDRVMFELTQGHYDRALSQLAGIPTGGRSEADQANLTGLALMLSGDAEKAVSSFDTALDLAPAMAEARLNRGVAWLRLGQYTKAVTDFQEIAGREKSLLRAQATYHLALAMDALGRGGEAARLAAAAVAIDPALEDALLLLGVVEERAGHHQEAGKAFKAYLGKRPDSAFATLRFAMTAQRAGFDETARKYLHKVIELAPDSAEAIEARKFLVLWE